MLHLFLFAIGICFILISVNYFWKRVDYVSGAFDRYDLYFNTRDIVLQGPIGVSFHLNVAKNDRLTAWKIFSQLKTRVAAVDFNENYDSALLVHQSLYKLFDLVRDEVSNIPVERVQRDKSDQTVQFYLSILNDGLRPHLSKWHVPLAKFVENEQKTHPSQSILEIEKRFPERAELISSLKDMNTRMQGYSNQLLEIVKAR